MIRTLKKYSGYIFIAAVIIYILVCCQQIASHNITDQVYSWWNILQYI